MHSVFLHNSQYQFTCTVCFFTTVNISLHAQCVSSRQSISVYMHSVFIHDTHLQYLNGEFPIQFKTEKTQMFGYKTLLLVVW